MGSVCASSLSLLNAGVPLRAPVAGIAMGLISDTIENAAGESEVRYAALTDIRGAEDAFGDMDFKVAGTSEVVTAIQLDTKLAGLPGPVLTGAPALPGAPPRRVRPGAPARPPARRPPGLGADRRAVAGPRGPSGDPRRARRGDRHARRDEPARPARPRSDRPGRQDRRGHRPQG